MDHMLVHDAQLGVVVYPHEPASLLVVGTLNPKLGCC